MRKPLLLSLLALGILTVGWIPPEVGAASPARSEISRQRSSALLADPLDLTAQQRTCLQVNLKGASTTLQPWLAGWQSARQTLRVAIQASTATAASIHAAAARSAAVEADLAVERQKIFAQIAPVLTPEQCQQLSAWRDRRDDLAAAAISRLGAGPDQ